MLAEVVEPGVPADEEAPILERLDVEIGIAQRRGVAHDFLDDVGKRDDSFRAAEFIDHDGEPLRMGEKTAEQIHRFHRLRHEGGRDQHLGVMLAGIEQKQFHVEDPDDLVRSVRIDRHAAMAPLLQLRDRFFVRQVVRQREGIHPRRHAILRGLVSQLDDLLDHLAFRFVQRALLFAHLDQRLEFFVAQARRVFAGDAA